MYSVYNIYIYILHFVSANKTFHKGTCFFLNSRTLNDIFDFDDLGTCTATLLCEPDFFFHLESSAVQGHRTKN